MRCLQLDSTASSSSSSSSSDALSLGSEAAVAEDSLAAAGSAAASAWPLDGWAAEGGDRPWYAADATVASSSSSASGSGRAGPPPPRNRLPSEHPVVLRGVASGWPALGLWSPDWLGARPGFEGRVRVAPSLQFPFCEPRLAELLEQARGATG
jgi:hypothetical protein